MEPQEDPLNDPSLGPSMPGDSEQKGPSPPGGIPYSSAIQVGKIIPATSPQQDKIKDPDWMDKLSGFNGNSSSQEKLGDWQSSSGTIPSGTGQSPTIPSPKQQPIPEPVTKDHPAIKKLSQSADQMLNANGAIDWEAMKYHMAQVGLDNENAARVQSNIDMAQKHIQDAQALGRKAAYDQSGNKYWEDESTGGKLARILEGIVTLGGSEAYIGTSIKRQVTADQRNLDTENNTYRQMIELGKSKEQAASIDAAKQGHLFQLGLDRVKMKYPKLSQDLQGKIAALQTGIEKETSLAMLGNIKQSQDNQVAKFNSQTSRMNADTERERLKLEKSKGPSADKLVRDANGNIIGNVDTFEQKKELESRMNAYKSIEKLSSKVDDYGWGDKFGAESRAKARGLHAEILNQIDVFRNAKPSQENTRVAALLERMIPDPDDFSTTPGSFKAGYKQALTMLGSQLATAQLQAGIK